MRKVIEFADLPQQKLAENLLCIMRPLVVDFQEHTWVETTAPYVNYLNSIYQLKENENQSYENFRFRGDFSLTRFTKELRYILSAIIDNSTETMRNVDETLTEEPETKDNGSEWSSQINPLYIGTME